MLYKMSSQQFTASVVTSLSINFFFLRQRSAHTLYISQVQDDSWFSRPEFVQYAKPAVLLLGAPEMPVMATIHLFFLRAEDVVSVSITWLDGDCWLPLALGSHL